MILLEENLKWHLEAFASELFKYQTFFVQFSTAIKRGNGTL